jgi:hypothetical protein
MVSDRDVCIQQGLVEHYVGGICLHLGTRFRNTCQVDYISLAIEFILHRNSYSADEYIQKYHVFSRGMPVFPEGVEHSLGSLVSSVQITHKGPESLHLIHRVKRSVCGQRIVAERHGFPFYPHWHTSNTANPDSRDRDHGALPIMERDPGEFQEDGQALFCGYTNNAMKRRFEIDITDTVDSAIHMGLLIIW